MHVSVLVHNNHLTADREMYELQVLVYLNSLHSPEKILQLLLTNYLCQ